MSKIADPLRHYADEHDEPGKTYIMLTRRYIHHLADDIDAEHERLIAEAKLDKSIAHKVMHGTGEYGHATCSACGVTVHRRDKWCWSCGARLHGEVEVRK